MLDKIASALAFSEFASDDRAQMGNVGKAAKVAISLVVALAVGGLVAAFLLPVAIDEIVGVDTSNWSDGAQSMWDLLDIVIVLAVTLFFFGIALRATDAV